MNKIRDAFLGGKAFIPFITCGDPDLETTKELIKALKEGGADIIELGIPFSDPTAEGPVIQEANIRAINGGVTTDKIFEMVSEIKKDVCVPLVFMTYANVVFSYGTERFIKKAKEAGIDGIILHDVPYEEKKEFAPVCEKYDMDLISLAVPAPPDRIKMIAKEAKGFVHCVSSHGVTGERSRITADIGMMTNLVKSAADIPCAAGFGISTPDQARQIAQYADGVIVGSAIAELVGLYGKKAAGPVREYAESIKSAIRVI